MHNTDLLISSLVMLGLDTTYISIIQESFLQQIEDIQNTKPNVNMMGVLLTYITMILGLNYFIIQKKAPLFDAFLFGIVLYGVFDGTNFALFSKWSTKLAIIDVLWGGFLMLVTTYLTYNLSSFF